MRDSLSTPARSDAIKLLILAILVPLAGLNASGQSWTNSYAGPGNNHDGATALVIGAQGNVYINGHSPSSSDWFSQDFATVAYSSSGEPLWTNRYGLAGVDEPADIAVGANGNVYVVGRCSEVMEFGNEYDYATVAYTSSGVPIWTNRFGGNGPGSTDDEARAVAVDTNGNIYVTGSSMLSSNTRSDFVTIAYSSIGLPLWTNLYNGPADGEDSAEAIAVGVDNKIFVTGRSEGIGTGFDYVTIAYDSSGLPLWTNRYDGDEQGISTDEATAIAVDGNGSVYVTGSAGDPTLFGDLVTISYAGSGLAQWTNAFGGNGSGKAITVDETHKRVLVAGYSDADGGDDYITIAYSLAGIPLWTNRYNGPGNGHDIPEALAVDEDGRVFVTGSSYGTGNSFEYATLVYSSAGLPLWTNRYSSGFYDGDARARALGLGDGGNLYVSGQATGAETNDDFVTIKYANPFAFNPAIWIDSPVVRNGGYEFTFTNAPGGSFSVLSTTNAQDLVTGWTVVEGLRESAPGIFDFKLLLNSMETQRLFRVRSP